MHNNPHKPVPLPKGDDLLAICCGNEGATDFIVRWHGYCHAIDDVVDEGYSAERFLQVLMMAIDVYSHPFYVTHARALRLVADLITNSYADSVAWEKDPGTWRFRMADCLRFAGVDMTLAVARLCGGLEHMRRVSPVIRDFAWQRQHTLQGEPH
jgi:hypothetical protein